MNSITAIFPYRRNGMWMFDDPAVGLREELFVSGIDKIIETLTTALGIVDAHDGFRLIFSGTMFPGYTTHMEHIGVDPTSHIPPLKKGGKPTFIPVQQRGNWYRHPETGMQGWLCPALLKYFDTPPEIIYVKIEADPDQAAKLKARKEANKLAPKWGGWGGFGGGGEAEAYAELAGEAQTHQADQDDEFVAGPLDSLGRNWP